MSDDRAGTLHVVATPLGNLEDITLRAIRTLREVSLIACEDTRRTAVLLRAHGIATALTSYFEHNERWKGAKILDALRAGRDAERLVAPRIHRSSGIQHPADTELPQDCRQAADVIFVRVRQHHQVDPPHAHRS